MKSEIDLITKAQEIVYVVSRIGFAMRRIEFRARIERLAFDLFESLALREVERALSLAGALEGFVQIGVSLYEIEIVNAQSLLHELSAIQSAIRQTYVADELPNNRQSATNQQSVAEVSATVADSENKDLDEADIPLEDQSGMTSIASTIRQSAILDKVRNMTARNQSSFVSGCRMKDLLTAFPQVSERTLRYDLQSLLERGDVLRLGSGGSNSFYVIK